MSKSLAYISFDTLLAKLARDIPSSLKYEEDDAIEWASEALSAIGAYNELDEKVYLCSLGCFSRETDF